MLKFPVFLKMITGREFYFTARLQRISAAQNNQSEVGSRKIIGFCFTSRNHDLNTVKRMLQVFSLLFKFKQLFNCILRKRSTDLLFQVDRGLHGSPFVCTVL